MLKFEKLKFHYLVWILTIPNPLLQLQAVSPNASAGSTSRFLAVMVEFL
jgi:hypothetical protein